MKKILAILVSLLFVASVFGVAQTMATVLPCDCQIIGPASVHVGDVFTVEVIKSGSCLFTINMEPSYVQFISKDPTANGDILTYKALQVGTAKEIISCNGNSYDVTVLSKALPFKFFAKLFGFGMKE